MIPNGAKPTLATPFCWISRNYLGKIVCARGARFYDNCLGSLPVLGDIVSGNGFKDKFLREDAIQFFNRL